MPPIYVKGGVWTNVEDEILKAAVQKYGLNQWDRVASLLTKKNAKQAKARWNEWLSPAINKKSWTSEEDEKLLNLVKLLPNQWRSIAPIMGRTATHCIERYQKLLEDSDDDDDDTRFGGAGIEAVPALGLGDGLGVGLGEVGTAVNPESKPARPDEDELEDADREMLFEARARLANTKGKKAKRRERERMLEETKRISLLQKRRELKAAGINVSLVLKNKKKSKLFDYNADIPFEHEPQAGLYDTSKEDEVNDALTSQFNSRVSKQGLEMEKKKLEKRDKPSNLKDKKRSIEGDAKLVEPQRKRTKPDLPGVVNMEEEADFETTELAGVFHGPEVVVDDVDARIARTKQEIKHRQGLKSTLLRDADEKIETSKVLKPKQKKKAIIGLLKSSFSSLPTPKNEFQILPVFDDGEETQLVKVSESQETQQRLKNLQLLRQVEEEKAKSRRSQVVQRGLDIPDYKLLKPIDLSKLTDLDKQIVMEFRSLIMSDTKKYVDNTIEAVEVDEIDEQLYNTVQKEIAQQLKEDELEDNSINVEIPQLTLSLKHDIAAQLKQNQQEILQLRNQIAAKKIDNDISGVAEAIIEQEQKNKLYEEISRVEQQSIDSRSKYLNVLVDQIVSKEQELSQYITS